MSTLTRTVRALHRCRHGERPYARGDAGVSLAELLVVMMLVLVLGTMVVTTFLQGANAVFASDARGADTQQAKIATENVSKLVRLAVDPDGVGVGTAFVTATPFDATFYAALGNRGGYPNADAPPKKVRIWLDGSGVLRQQVIDPVVSGVTVSWPGSGTTRVVGRDLLTGTSATPLFTYLAAGDTGAGADGVAVTSLPNTSGSVTTATGLAAIEAVEIWVGVTTQPAKRSTATTAVTRVTLLNRA